ncbi:MAG: a-factor receptor [Piccolia ochrophora]|nr:MAG: a-factor receptor [Piccolia ochrophora]
MRNLALVMDVDRVTIVPTRAQRRRRLLVDLLWCYGCPVYLIAIDYICQAGRYYIFTISGCTPAFDNSWVTVVLIFIWPPVFCIAGSYYCSKFSKSGAFIYLRFAALLIIRLYKYRKQFTEILSSSNSHLNKSRFLRLFLIAIIMLLVFLPTQLYLFFLNVSYPRHPYDWDTIHGEMWHDIILVPTGGRVAFDRWIRVVAGFVLFFFFGMGRDAKNMYRNWLLGLGLGKVFPSAFQATSSTSTSTTESKIGAFSSRARMLFRKGSNRTTTFASTCPSENISASSPTPSDMEKSFTGLRSSGEAAPTFSAPPPIDPQPWRPLATSAPLGCPVSVQSGPSHTSEYELQADGVFTDIRSGTSRGSEDWLTMPRGVMIRREISQSTSSRRMEG